MWVNGIEVVDKQRFRQLPQRYTWSSQVFVGRRGRLLRRFFNPIEQSFAWQTQDLIEEVVDGMGTGRIGMYVQQGHFLPIDILIALAWRCREPDTPTRVLIKNGEPTASNVRWVEEEGDDMIDHSRETWRPLRCKLGLIPVDDAYLISSHGRLQSPKGDITRGFWWDDARWAYAKPSGLINLTQEASRQRGATIFPSIFTAIDCLMDGHTPDELAYSQGIQETTAWSYMCRGIPHIRDVAGLRRVGKELVPKELWRLLKHMKRDSDPLLGERLRDLMVKCEAEIDGFEEEEFKYEYLRFARSILLA